MASARVIGQKMAAKAMELYEKAEAQPPLLGPINYRSIRVNMTNVRIDPLVSSLHCNNVTTLNRMKTCKPAMGYGFAAGTIDGPGLSYFHQGDKHPQHYLWDTLRNLLREPSAQQAKCHFPKPILISGGEIKIPYAWLPEVIELQVFRIGSLLILTNPSEITTMAGRRIIKAMQTLISGFLGDTEDFIILLTTISNGYSSYLTTFEEYHAQRYEGSSTLYGPYSLDAYILQYTKLVKSLFAPSEGTTSTTESDANQAMIPDQSDQYLQLSRFVQSDQLPFFGKFGDILKDARANYKIGEKVQVTFQGANPSNHFSRIKSFMYVQRRGTSCDGGTRAKVVDEKADFQNNVYWEDIFDDFDDCTLFDWRYTSSVWTISEVTLCWTIPQNTINGMYRIVYNGMQRAQENTFIPFQGISSTFHVNRD